MADPTSDPGWSPADPDRLVHEVGVLLRSVAGRVILPWYRRLGDDDIMEKAPGEVVTVADREAEELLSTGLRQLLPGSVVVGEEGVAADPTRLARLRGSAPVWLVDPIDGTSNFAAGCGPFAVMVALLHGGTTRSSWILDPVDDRLLVARAGAGVHVDGTPLDSAPAFAATTGGATGPVPGGTAGQVSPAALRGAVASRFLPPVLRDSVHARAGRLGQVLPPQHCAGREYPDIVTGRQHFVIFWRTLPWDHAPGALLVREAGGVVRRFDGAEYDPTDERTGLLAAASEEIWVAVHRALFAPDGS